MVESYTYLGVEFNKDLNLDRMVTARMMAGRGLLGMMRPSLTNRLIPLACKVRMIQNILLPRLSYGAELWGMSDKRVAPAAKVLRDALMGGRTTLLLKYGLLCIDLKIPPLEAFAAKARVRAYDKYSTLRSWISGLIAAPHHARACTGTTSWKRNQRNIGPIELEDNDGDQSKAAL